MEWMNLDDAFVIIRNGKSIKQHGEDGYPITRIETIADRYVDETRVGYASIYDLEEYEDYILQKGDILMSHINSVKHLAKTAIFNSESTIIHGMNLLCLRADKNIIDPYYGFYYLNSDVFLGQIPQITKNSVNQASFNITNLKELKIPVPPMEIQKQTVEVLDEAQRLIDNRKKQIELLDDLIESIFYDMFGDPVRNDKGWKVDSIGDNVANKIENINSDYSSAISYIDISSIDNDKNKIIGYTNYESLKNAPSRAKKVLKFNDVIISTVRSNLNNVALFNIRTKNKAIGSTGLCILRPNNKLNSTFLFYIAKSKSIIDSLVNIAKGASHPAVSDNDVKNINIGIPHYPYKTNLPKRSKP